MLSFDDILPSKKIFGGDPPNQPKTINMNSNFKQKFNKQKNVISTNTETDTKIEPKTKTNPYDYTVPKQQNLINPTRYPFKQTNNYYQNSNEGNKHSNQSFNNHQKPFNNQNNTFNNHTNTINNRTNSFNNQNKTSQNDKQNHYNKPADNPSDNSRSFKSKQFNRSNKNDDTRVNVTQEALFTPITKINKLNAPMIEQPRQVDSRVAPVREIVYEIPRVENRYIIANDNPYQNINRLNFLYEDFIPDPLMPDKILTINDRFNLGEFISNNVLSLFEKDTDKYYLGKAEQQIIKSLYTNEIDGLSKIFSKIKSLKLNPNFEGNNNMPKDFMIFKSCYPIRRTDLNVTCSKTSQSVNLRIYKTPFITDTKTTPDGTNYQVIKEIPEYSHINSELNYYMQINNIIKSKESPNFPICYGIVKNIYDKTITFESKKPTELKISESDDKYDIQMKSMTDTTIAAYDFLYEHIINKYPEVNKSDIEDKTKKLKEAIEDNYKKYISIKSFTTNQEHIRKLKNASVNQMKTYLNQLFKKFNFRDFERWRNDKNTEKEPKKDDTILLLDSNNELVKINKSELDYVITFSLCESPDWSYKEWTSPQTIRQYGVAKMIESGWHTDEEKEIFTFQLLYALLVMLKNKIYIPNFGIDNIFIKKIKTSDMQTKIFVYEIDGIKYYIPNKGFYVMIDQRYANTNYEAGHYYDQDTHPYNKNVSIGNTVYHESITDIIKKFINTVLINDLYICKKSLVKEIPDPATVAGYNYLGCIRSIRDLILYNFMKYANNRNGTIISADEFRLINGNVKPLINYECGELVLESVDNNTRYRVAQIVSLPNDSDTVFIQTVDSFNNKAIMEKKIIELFSVKNNSFFRQIKDKYIRSDDNIIDTYSISMISTISAFLP